MRSAVWKLRETGPADLKGAGVAALHSLLIALVTNIAFGGSYCDECVVVCGARKDLGRRHVWLRWF
jgi:hypothetical protein